MITAFLIPLVGFGVGALGAWVLDKIIPKEY